MLGPTELLGPIPAITDLDIDARRKRIFAIAPVGGEGKPVLYISKPVKVDVPTSDNNRHKDLINAIK